MVKTRYLNFICLLALAIITFISEANAVTVCSQNLFRLGEKDKPGSPGFERQKNFLVSRIKSAECDLIALQELTTSKNSKSAMVLELLSNELNKTMRGKSFKSISGKTLDQSIGNAFLYNEREFDLIDSYSVHNRPLPKFSHRSAPYIDIRSPLVVVLKSKSGLPNVIAINYHFKSKVGGYKDKTNTDFEVLRTLSAFGVREELDVLKYKYPNSIDLYMGDRNGGQRSSSAMVLSGELKLEDFTNRERGCEISQTGVALCRPEVYGQMDMLPILYLKEKNEGRKMTTYRHGSKDLILDDIYVSSEDKSYVEDTSGHLRAGTVGEYRKGSDHLLSWIELSSASR